MGIDPFEWLLVNPQVTNGKNENGKHIKVGENCYKTSMKKSYNSYSPGFIYQYVNIGGENGMLADEICCQVVQDIKEAYHLLSKFRK